ncbi:MAG: hypothetical protein AAB393_15560, partial [Bacteroidota bacterium]
MKTYLIRPFVLILLLSLSCTGPVGPQGPAGAGGNESLTDPSIQPRIIYTSPSNNSQGPYLSNPNLMDYGNVVLRFNKIMDAFGLPKSSDGER